jgi:thiol:disulfide interchange protein DsbD
MVTFKLMAFPFATVVYWWVLGQQSGIDGAAAGLLVLLALALAADAARRHPHRFATLAFALLAVSTWPSAPTRSPLASATQRRPPTGRELGTWAAWTSSCPRAKRVCGLHRGLQGA